MDVGRSEPKARKAAGEMKYSSPKSAKAVVITANNVSRGRNERCFLYFLIGFSSITALISITNEAIANRKSITTNISECSGAIARASLIANTANNTAQNHK